MKKILKSFTTIILLAVLTSTMFACTIKPEDAYDKLVQASNIDFLNTKGFSAQTTITYERKMGDTWYSKDEHLTIETVNSKKLLQTFLYSKRLTTFDITVGGDEAEKYYQIEHIYYYKGKQFKHTKYTSMDKPLIDADRERPFEQFRSDYQSSFESILAVFDETAWQNIETKGENGGTTITFDILQTQNTECFTFIFTKFYQPWEGRMNPFKEITSVNFEYFIKGGKIMSRNVQFVGIAPYSYNEGDSKMTYTTIFAHKNVEPDAPTSAMFTV